MTTLGSSLPLFHEAVRSVRCGAHNLLASPAAADLYSPSEAAQEPQFPLEKGMMTTSPILQAGCQQCVSRELVCCKARACSTAGNRGPLAVRFPTWQRSPESATEAFFLFMLCVCVCGCVHTRAHTYIIHALLSPQASSVLTTAPPFSAASYAVPLNGRRNRSGE